MALGHGAQLRAQSVGSWAAVGEIVQLVDIGDGGRRRPVPMGSVLWAVQYCAVLTQHCTGSNVQCCLLWCDTRHGGMRAGGAHLDGFEVV